MIRGAIRDYLVREIEPLVPQLEDGSLLPFEPLRKMAATLGLVGPEDELTRMMKESPAEEMLPFFVPRILSVEMSRVCAASRSRTARASVSAAATSAPRARPSRRSAGPVRSRGSRRSAAGR